MEDPKNIKNDGIKSAAASIKEKRAEVEKKGGEDMEEEEKMLDELNKNNQLRLEEKKDETKNTKEKSQQSLKTPGTIIQLKAVEHVVILPHGLLPGDVR